MLKPLPQTCSLLVILSLSLFGGCAPLTMPPPAAALLGDDAVGPDAPRVSRTDVNGDGTVDWVADFSDRLAWCGSGGCRQVVIVSRPGGHYAVAFDEQAQTFRLRHRRGTTRLDVEIYGAWCGEAGVAACHRRFDWRAEDERFVEAPNGRGDTRLTGPLFQVVPATLPRKLKTGPCEVQTASVPDLDGDGRRDAVAQSGPCGAQDLVMTLVWVSTLPNRFAATRPDPRYEIDISTKPARLWMIPSDCASPCASALVAWNPASELRAAEAR